MAQAINNINPFFIVILVV
uniref:Uncharacterized protein n=1 Tax=Anguilla anguilla TaxID=7936 RepID=A0A0E9R882_ANGAN